MSPQKAVKFSTFEDVEMEEETNISDFYRSHARSRQRLPHESGKRARSSSPTTVVRLEREVSSQTEKVKTLAVDCEELKSQKRMSDVRVKHLEKDVEQSRKDAEHLKLDLII